MSIDFSYQLLVPLQVIFPALDNRVKNVARTYSLEHEEESVLFDQLFVLLNSYMQNEEGYRREFASRTGALQTSISQHMSKEEKQVSFFLIGVVKSWFIQLTLQISISQHMPIGQHTSLHLAELPIKLLLLILSTYTNFKVCLEFSRIVVPH